MNPPNPPPKPPLVPPAALSPLDEDTRPRSTAPSRGGGLPCALGLLVFLLSLTVILLVGIILYRPDVVGLGLIGDLTRTQVGFVNTAQALDNTAQAIQAGVSTNAQAALANETTRAANAVTQSALDSRQASLDQSSTQAALDQTATQAAVAALNAQQATSNALVFQQTQAAINLTATQAALQATQAAIQFQGTQAAIAQNATAAALGFVTGTPSSAFLSATPPPPLFDERFSGGFTQGLWTFSAVADWRLGDSGALLAAGTTNWLLTQQADFAEYIFDADLTVLQGPPLISFNYVLLNVPAEQDAPGGLALQLVYDGRRLTTVGLYRLTRAQLLERTFLSEQGLEALQAVQIANGPPAGEAQVRVEVRGQRVIAAINGGVVFDILLTDPPPPGAVGLYVPVGTQVRRVALLP